MSVPFESERAATTAVASVQRSAQTARSESWWSRLMHRSWELSLSQMTGAVAAITLTVALITAFSMQRIQQSDAGATTSTVSSGGSGRANTTDASTISVSDVDGRMRQQQLAIEYWNQRIEERKASWSPQMREAFERNMTVIDQAVNYSRDELRRNPHDEVSEEMLNSALNDKMALLREFADL